MDTFLFQNLAQPRGLPEDGPQNQRRSLAYIASIWLQGPHEDFPLCDFADYLVIRGWDKEKLKRGLWREAHPGNRTRSDIECTVAAISTIQSWLTFGFLESVFQERVPVGKYVRRVNPSLSPILKYAWDTFKDKLSPYLGKPEMEHIEIFYTQHLVSHLVHLSFKHRQAVNTGVGSEEYALRFKPAYREFANALAAFDQVDVYLPESNQRMNPQDPDTPTGFYFHWILLFPTLLGETVRTHLSALVPDVEITEPRQVTKLFVKRLLKSQSKWCPWTIEKLQTTTNYSVIWWLFSSMLEDMSKKPHDNCDEKACVAYRVPNESAYPTEHVNGCNGYCDVLHPDMGKIAQVYTSGGVPLILAEKAEEANSATKYDFNILRHDPSDESATAYSAFSHVWADGFGSTTEKGMPMCQVEFLVDAASSVQQTQSGLITFWIDSLCIPGDRNLRRRAIETMASVYKSANSVIVLDQTLQQCSIKSSPEELLLRIYTSPWMNRVWTYQEGVLASKLYFKLSDGYCPLDFPLMEADVAGPLHIPIFLDNMHDIYNYLRVQLANLNGAIRPINISHVAIELRWRDTLHRDPNGKNDELVAVGVLLGLNMADLLEAKGLERMKRFLIMVKQLPRNIIFTEANKLPFAGFRWAPTTFLVRDSRRPRVDLDDKGVLCTTKGLLGRYIVFQVSKSRPVHQDWRKRHTIIDTTSGPAKWFDITDPDKTAFDFDFIIILPEELPESKRNTIMVAAAALSSDVTESDGDLKIVEGQSVDLVCNYQRLIHLAIFRDFSSLPPAHFDREPVFVDGRFASKTILLR
jgi:hypothetical protein